MTQPPYQRYLRQMILPRVGADGQARLAAATVLVTGAGGLGSPAALYLAAAGVGSIILMDGDRVELSNLGRQILHGADSVGRPKAESGARTLARLNPSVRVEAVEEWVDEENAEAWVARADAVVDGSDNYETRVYLNRACHRLGKPYHFGAVLGFEGQAATFRSGLDPEAPCFQCLFPQGPPPGAANCATAGVLGPLAGVVGCLQAAEALRELLGVGRGLTGALLLMDLLEGTFRRIRLRKEPDCPVCSGKG